MYITTVTTYILSDIYIFFSDVICLWPQKKLCINTCRGWSREELEIPKEGPMTDDRRIPWGIPNKSI
jgi:hypothetical protein